MTTTRTLLRDRSALLATAALLPALFATATAQAHDVNLTEVLVTFRDDQRYVVHMRYDVDAFLIGVRPEHLTADDLRRLKDMPADERAAHEAELRDMLRRRVRLSFDGQRVMPEIAFVSSGLPPAPPPPATAPASPAAPSPPTVDHASRVETIIELTGPIPPEAEAFEFRASRSFGTIILQAGREGGPRSHEIIEPGAGSRPIHVSGVSAPPPRREIARQYLLLGFEHILPKGLDHILFVVGLFLLGTRLAPLLWQVTAFTVAHTLTLALSMYGVVNLPAGVVEPLIALSIAYVAIENICTSRLHAWRPVVVFLFGLLHGLGFAGVLMELGLPRERFATALVSFNVGVELGQLAVILLAMVAVGWWREHAWYRRRIVVPASALIAVVGLFWTVERVM